MRITIGYLWLVALALLGGAMRAQADVHVPGIFGSNMVLQRDKVVPLWGTASPGEKVTVTFAGQTAIAQTGADGQWQVRLKPMKASDQPRTLTIAGTNTLTLDNVLVGEVWICSGQSNMELPPRQGLLNPEAEIAAAHWPKLRMILVHKVVADRPLSDVQGTWANVRPNPWRSSPPPRISLGARYIRRSACPSVWSASIMADRMGSPGCAARLSWPTRTSPPT